MKGIVVISDPDFRANHARSDRLEALECVGNQPIAHHVLDALQSAGADEVIVASSAERATEVRGCLESRELPGAPTLRFVCHRTRMDVGGALSLAAPVVDGSPCIVHYGSGLLGEPLEALVDRVQGAWPDAVLILHQSDAGRRHLTLTGEGSSDHGEIERASPSLDVAGVCLFGPDGIARACASGSTTGRDSDLKHVADRLVGQGGSVDVLRVHGWRHYGGDPLDLLELNRIVLDQLVADPPRLENHGNRIEGRVRIHEHAFVRSSVIVGPTVIGAGAHVSEAYIGPYTSVGARAVIEGAEIERSIVDVGARITHVGGRLASSVVGREARVLRDFSLPRALRLRVGDGAEVALS